MKSTLIVTTLLCIVINSYCQLDNSLPVKIELKLIKSKTSIVTRKWGEEFIKKENLQVTTDSIKVNSFDIEVSITNTSQDSIVIVLMSCSWEEDFEINNDYMEFSGINCNSNFPDPIPFRSGETKTFKTTLERSIKFDYPPLYSNYGPEEPTTRVGLIVNDVSYNPKLTLGTYESLEPMDKSKWRIIWSNPLYLLGK